MRDVRAASAAAAAARSAAAAAASSEPFSGRSGLRERAVRQLARTHA